MPLLTEQLKTNVLTQLLDLNFHAYLQTISLVLTRMGYEDVTLATRTGFVGRNQDGGIDLWGYRSVSGGRRPVVIQAKQYDPKRFIYQRSLDELRGVVLRARAAEGILITTSAFSQSVSRSRAASAPVAPLRLIDGTQLADEMALYRVGVIKGPLPKNVFESRYQLDPEYFARIEHSYVGVARPPVGQRLYTGILVSSTPRKRRN